MFLIDWILGKFNYYKFYKVDIDTVFAEMDKQYAKPVTKKPARKVVTKKPTVKKATTAKKKA